MDSSFRFGSLNVSMKLGLMVKQSPPSIQLASELIQMLKSKHQISAHPRFPGIPELDLDQDLDMILTIGGDGTLLRALAHSKAPVLGIRAVGLGFLCELDSSDLPRIPDLISELKIAERMKIQAEIQGSRYQAVNDIALISKDGKLVGFEIHVDGAPLEKFRADGLIFSSPQGSTAYALSAGGPIMDPDLDAILMTPLAPFKLGMRAMVFRDDRKIQVTCSREVKVLVDGNQVAQASRAIISSSETKAKLAVLNPNPWVKLPKSLSRLETYVWDR